MKRFSLFILLSLFVISSCRKEEENTTVIRASIPEEARTVLAFPRLHWSEGDAIVVNGKVSTGIQISAEACYATFTLPLVNAPYQTLYPAIAYDGSSLTLPEEQTYVAGSFDPSAALMYGWSESSADLAFHCGTAFLKIIVQGSGDTHDIKRVEIASGGSEGLSGKFTFNASTHRLDKDCPEGKKVIVRSTEGIPQGSPIYAAIAPGTYASGLKLRIVDMKGHYRDLTSSNAFVAQEGTVYDTAVSFEPTGTIIDGSTSDSETPAKPVAVTKEGTLIRTGVADPCLLYENGRFYLTMTGTSNIAMVTDTALDQLTTAAHPMSSSLYIYQSSKDPNVKAMFGDDAVINGTWSPEIHHFSEEDFPGMSGWYMFLSLRKKEEEGSGSTSSQVRMVVLKSQSDSPQGPYGDPLDGAVNKSRQVQNAAGYGISEWSCGQTVLRIPSGKYAGIYALWVEEVGRGLGYGNFYQKIMISKMSSPWRFTGETGIVTTPTQVWEKDGADATLPMVVEGAAAIYGAHGEIFLAYCGSGYWSLYGLGQLTLKMEGDDYADPLQTDSWIKHAKNPPVFSSRHAEDLRGAGHGFFIKDEKGNGFFCYHAYPVVDGVKASSRNAYMEPYYIDYDTKSPSAPYGLLMLGINGDRCTAPVSSSFTFYVKGN